MPILYPARAWQPARSRFVSLYHGCTGDDRLNMEANGIQVSGCRVDTDFGRGFYMTTLRRQARQWAWIRYYSPGVRRSGNQPVILRFLVEREVLGKCCSLQFVRGDFNSLDFWSLVQHCRSSTTSSIRHHERSTGSRTATSGDWYDTVSGPVAAFWDPRVAMQGADQLSFHTQPAVDSVLMPLMRSSGKDSYEWEPVDR
jgi:hypothetical protein